MSERICTHCQATVPEAARFCTSCGTAFDAGGASGASQEDETSIIPTGRGPSDATAVLPTSPKPAEPYGSPPGTFDPNATFVGNTPPPAPSGGEPPPGYPGGYGQPHGAPSAYGGQGQAPPMSESPGGSSYPPPAQSYPPQGQSYGQPSAYGQPAAYGQQYPPQAQPVGQSYPPQGQQWSDARAPVRKGKPVLGGVLAFLAGIATIAAAFLPWAVKGDEDFAGWDISADAKADVGLGVAALVIGLLLILVARGKFGGLLRLVTAGIGVAVLATTVVDILSVQDDPIEPDLGIGLFVLIGSGLALLLASVLPATRPKS